MVTWMATGNALPMPPSGTQTTLTAPFTPGPFTIRAFRNGVVCQQLSFDVLAPDSEDCTLLADVGYGALGPPSNRIGARSKFECTIMPNTVSFVNANFIEDAMAVSWTWPDGATGNHPLASLLYTYGASNRTIDEVGSGTFSTQRLAGAAPGFILRYDRQLQLSYFTDGGTQPFHSQVHPRQFRAVDAKARVGIDSIYGEWQGPWQ